MFRNHTTILVDGQLHFFEPADGMEVVDKYIAKLIGRSLSQVRNSPNLCQLSVMAVKRIGRCREDDML